MPEAGATPPDGTAVRAAATIGRVRLDAGREEQVATVLGALLSGMEPVFRLVPGEAVPAPVFDPRGPVPARGRH